MDTLDTETLLANIQRMIEDNCTLLELKCYIEAMGGKLKLAVELPTGDEQVIRI